VSDSARFGRASQPATPTAHQQRHRAITLQIFTGGSKCYLTVLSGCEPLF